MTHIRVLTVNAADAPRTIDLRDHVEDEDVVTMQFTSTTVAEADAVAHVIDPSAIVVQLGHDSFPAFALVARLHHAHPNVPVIVVAPIGDPRLASLAVLLGADALVVGPRSREELPVALAAVLEGHRWFSPLLLHELFQQVQQIVNDPQATANERLSPREREVARLAAQGLRYRAIAERLHITPRTVRSHVRNIVQKLNVPSVQQALAAVEEIGKEVDEEPSPVH